MDYRGLLEQKAKEMSDRIYNFCRQKKSDSCHKIL